MDGISATRTVALGGTDKILKPPVASRAFSQEATLLTPGESLSGAEYRYPEVPFPGWAVALPSSAARAAEREEPEHRAPRSESRGRQLGRIRSGPRPSVKRQKKSAVA